MVFCGLAAGFSGVFGVAAAQEFSRSGGEVPASGARLGDQVFPALSLGPEGGYVVWQDSLADGRGKGQGVMAQRLDANLQPGGEPFLLSQKTVGHQESPGVAMLTQGGAAFTWLGPKHSSPDVFTRFLGPDGNFLGTEVQVNPLSSRLLRTNRVVQMTGYRANRLRNLTFRLLDSARVRRDRNQSASVIALPDGGALVTYAGGRRLLTNWQEVVRTETLYRGRYITNDVIQKRSESQDWMLDVFFQRFGADGRKIGGEVQVNQFARYNQQAPSVALLANGTFVVTWVSETFVDNFRRSFEVYAGTPLVLAQVDIIARLFAADGTPLSHEFTVNDVLRTCSSPSVAALPDGRFTVAWSQQDGIRTNGWDIYTRTFDADGEAEGGSVRVNSHTYGDQYAPRLSSAGSRQILVWSSLGQDKAGSASGSFVQRDGSVVTINLGRPASVPAVYGRELSGGVPVGTEFRVNTSLTAKPMQPALASDGFSRVLAVWSGRAEEGGFDLYSQAFSAPPPVAGGSAPGGLPLPGGGAPAAGAGFRVAASASAEKLHLNWTGASGTRYQVQVSSNLVDWASVGDPRTSTGEPTTISLPRGGTVGFYRIVQLP